MIYLTQKLHEVTSQCQMAQNTFSNEACELLTEILSILYKTVGKITVAEQQRIVTEHVITEEVLSDMQLLLSVKHNVLLRCVFESILTLFEWTGNLPEPLNIGGFFANSFTVDKLLQIIETFSDDFRSLSSEVLTYLFRAGIAVE